MYRIEADLLIPGRGAPIQNGCVITDQKKIVYAGHIEQAPAIPADIDVATLSVPVVMPGLWECHGHFIGILTANLEEFARTPVSVAAARCVKDAELALMAGFTSVREVGGLGVYLARAINEGTIMGPHIYAAGAILSQTAGHFDLHSLPLECISGLVKSEHPFRIVDGIAECIKGVREQLRLDAKLIKVCASGGVMTELDHPIHQQFRDDELKVMVEEAKRVDKIVAAHCHGKPGILAALRAGCHTIEHGSYVDDEISKIMRAQGAILVPTRYIVDQLLRYAKEVKLPDYALKKVKNLAEQHYTALQTAIKNKVTIALGTDIGLSGTSSVLPWGANGQEFTKYVEAGMTPLEAIETGTANGPLSLGPQAPKSGQLQAGFDADLIVLTENPLENISCLGQAENIKLVMKDGVVVKNIL